MASGLISGILGGFKGAGTAVAIMADDQRKALAERLKAQYEEEAQIRSEGRTLANQKELVKFGNEQPMSIADAQKMGMEQTNKMSQLSVEQQNRLAEIKASGATEQEVNAARIKLQNEADLGQIAAYGEESRKTASVKDASDPKVIEAEGKRAKEMLALRLQQKELPVGFDPDTGAISGQPLTKDQQKTVQDMAAQLNIDVSFGEKGEVDNPGLLTGNSEVRPIGMAVYLGPSENTGKTGVTGEVEDEATAELKAIMDSIETTPANLPAPKKKQGIISSKMEDAKPDRKPVQATAPTEPVKLNNPILNKLGGFWKSTREEAKANKAKVKEERERREKKYGGR